ncbi:MAG: L,D-transpeptidase family protein [Ruminococcus sp.]|nr:L,D-transpeptidase family protein [Ruminococcus sp.]
MDDLKITRSSRNPGRKLTKNRIKIITALALSAILAIALLTAAIIGVVRLISGTKQAQSFREPAQVVSSMENHNTVSMELAVGDVCKLSLPDAADLKGVEFESSDPAVVRVDGSGRADALGEGKATVTATGYGFAAACEFKVEGQAQIIRPSEVTTAFKANEDVLQKNQEKSQDDLYNLVVNRRTNTVTVYTYDDSKQYTVPVRAMVASCGTGGDDITPTGEFALYFKEEWHALFDNVYGMYVSGIDGPYLFHSVPYEVFQDPASLETQEYNKLSTNASQGCVRLAVADAKWIFDNCPLNTPVKIIDEDASADPLGTPAPVKIDESIKWDPTDPDEKNPYHDKSPTISGAEDRTIKKGDEFKAFEGITAYDICSNNITGKLEMMGTVIPEKKGVYYVTYSVTDDFHLKTSVTVAVTVE